MPSRRVDSSVCVRDAPPQPPPPLFSHPRPAVCARLGIPRLFVGWPPLSRPASFWHVSCPLAPQNANAKCGEAELVEGPSSEAAPSPPPPGPPPLEARRRLQLPPGAGVTDPASHRRLVAEVGTAPPRAAPPSAPCSPRAGPEQRTEAWREAERPTPRAAPSDVPPRPGVQPAPALRRLGDVPRRLSFGQVHGHGRGLCHVSRRRAARWDPRRRLGRATAQRLDRSESHERGA